MKIDKNNRIKKVLLQLPFSFLFIRFTLLRHSMIYLLGRGIPGFINFITIAIYTRLLIPEMYGRYTLIVASVGLLDGIIYQWLRLSLFRFYSAYQSNEDERKALLSTCWSLFCLLSLSIILLGIVIFWLWPLRIERPFVLVGIMLLVAQGWYELNRILVQIDIKPFKFALISGIKSAIALGGGVGLILTTNFGAYAPLLSLVVALFFSPLAVIKMWKQISFRLSKPIVISFFKYGSPFVMTFVLAFIINTSDRFLIAHFLDEAAVGEYAASYDFAQQFILMTMMVINLAGYPLALQALENEGERAAQRQLLQNGVLLFYVGLPAAAAMAVMAPTLADLFLGKDYQSSAAFLLPWIAIAIFFSGLRSYYFDLSFQMGKRTLLQIGVMGVAAVANFLLNLWCIPKWGIVGAAYTTFAAYLIALLSSIFLGRFAFKIGIPFTHWLYSFIATILMSVVLLGIASLYKTGWKALFLQVSIGGGIYITTMLLFLYRSRLAFAFKKRGTTINIL